MIFGILYLPHFFKRLKQEPEKRKFFRERFGHYQFDAGRQSVVWIHAVSVGEVMAVKELARSIGESYPEIQIVLSTTTPTGQALARKFENSRIRAIYFPFDFRRAVRRALDTIRPVCIIVMETEIWPNFICEAFNRRIPIGIVNGRISDRAVKRYRWVKSFFSSLLSKFSYCFVCGEKDKKRFLELGVKPASLQVTGNMKFDQETKQSSDVIQELKNVWELSDHKVLIGGSTHEGEETVLIQVFQMLRREFPGLKLMIAPRHVERAGRVSELLQNSGVSAVLTSSGYQKIPDALVIDQMGLLSKYYGLADIVFIGGSLIRHGGQNPIEAALQQKPVLHGPFVSNFEEVYTRLDESEGAFQVDDKNALYQESMSFLSDQKRLERAGRAAFQVVQSLKGATRKNLELLKPFLSNEKVYRN